MSKRSKNKKSPAKATTAAETKSTSASQHAAPARQGFPWMMIPQALIIIAVGVWIYYPVMHGGWLMDDNAYVTQNPQLRDPYGLFNFWLLPGSFVEYYPIEETLLWTLFQFCHNDSFGYHVTTLVLHIIGSLLVWYFFSKLKLRFAWLGGLIFAIHPAQVESVAWVAELKNTLSTPPFLLAMCYWIDFENKGRVRDYTYTLLLFLAAMLCKITMAPFPVIMLLYAWWKRGVITQKDILHSIPFFIISLILGLTTIYVGGWYAPGHVLKITMGTDDLDFWGRLALAGTTATFYFVQVFLPIQMLPAYPQWKITPTLQQFFPLVIMAIILCWLWARRKTWGKHCLLGLGFFILIIAPFLGLNGVSYMRFTWVMDHFLYLPMLGLLGLAIAGVELIYNRLNSQTRPVLMGALALIVITLTLESASYAKKFKSLETVWSYEIQYSPDSWLAHNNLGYIYVDQNRLPEAQVQFQ